VDATKVNQTGKNINNKKTISKEKEKQYELKLDF